MVVDLDPLGFLDIPWEEVSVIPLFGMYDKPEIMTGYSFKTNLYGLAVDTLMEYELVLPTGEIKIVTEKDEDLWFALKVR